ncbi:MAG TPA: hypothetical protein VF507_03140 [Pyrinomonadaceae bacterium]|jgi:hypothetical protein
MQTMTAADTKGATGLRRGERGAALVTVLLISLLLLTAGGALILVAATGGTNTIDATSEMKAYYGAEAGLQATLNVLRQNVPPGAPLPSPLPSPRKIDFRIAVTPQTSNAPGDPASGMGIARLSRYLTYSASYPGRIPVNSATYTLFSGAAYSIIVTDPDDPTGSIRNGSSTYQPARLIVTSIGYGPRGAQKRLEMMVTSLTLNYNAMAMALMRGSDAANDPMSFTIGNSNAKTYSGKNRATVGPSLIASFGVTNSLDYNVADTEIKNSQYSTVNNPAVTLVTSSQMPDWLQSADAARAFIAKWKRIAQTGVDGKYYPPAGNGSSLTGTAGGTSPSDFTFVDGNCNLTGGTGLLIVTGDLILKGTNPDFSGLILVVGNGRIIRSGGGNGYIYGALVVANVPAAGGFDEPSFNTSGGGGLTMQFDAAAVQAALRIGNKAIGVAEK